MYFVISRHDSTCFPASVCFSHSMSPANFQRRLVASRKHLSFQQVAVLFSVSCSSTKNGRLPFLGHLGTSWHLLTSNRALFYRGSLWPGRQAWQVPLQVAASRADGQQVGRPTGSRATLMSSVYVQLQKDARFLMCPNCIGRDRNTLCGESAKATYLHKYCLCL